MICQNYRKTKCLRSAVLIASYSIFLTNIIYFSCLILILFLKTNNSFLSNAGLAALILCKKLGQYESVLIAILPVLLDSMAYSAFSGAINVKDDYLICSKGTSFVRCSKLVFLCCLLMSARYSSIFFPLSCFTNCFRSKLYFSSNCTELSLVNFILVH